MVSEKESDEPLNEETFAKAQETDSRIKRLWAIARNKYVYQPSEGEIEDAQGLAMRRGMVMKNVPDSTGQMVYKIVTPLSLQRRVVRHAHEEGHGGVHCTLEAVRRYHWLLASASSVWPEREGRSQRKHSRQTRGHSSLAADGTSTGSSCRKASTGTTT